MDKTTLHSMKNSRTSALCSSPSGLRYIPAREDGGALTAIRGMALTFNDNPFISCNPEDCYTLFDDALIVMQDGCILAVGEYAEVAPLYPEISTIERYDDAVIMPGMVDCHVHYVQSPMIGSYGDTLISWLNRYTFPTEARFANREFADEVARIFFRTILSQGTTTANIFATTFAESVDAIFEEALRLGMRVISGKVLQDRNLPDNLRDSSAEESVCLSEDLMNKWHGRERLLYAVIPRFAPTSTPQQLRLAGELYQSHIGDGVYMHTHLDEAEDEIRWVAELFPESKSYTDVYDHFGLLGRRSVMAHCCILKEEEWKRLHEAQCGVAHCPSSNLFLGDGEFRFAEALRADRALKVGIGTDVGGGTNFSVMRQLGDAYKVAMLHDYPLGIERSLYMATLGGARVLDLDDRIGALKPGYEADIAVVDLHPNEFASWRMQFCSNVMEKLFVLKTLAPDNLIRATYVAGTCKYRR